MVAGMPKCAHKITVDDLTLECSCGWKKKLEYRYKANEEIDRHYDETMPDRFTMNHAPKNSRDRVPVLV